MIGFAIVELVRTSKGNHREKVEDFGADYERSARLRYKELVDINPHTYFELLKVDHKEECLDYTKDRA